MNHIITFIHDFLGDIDFFDYPASEEFMVNYAELSPVIVNAIQELKKEKDALETKVDSLTSTMSNLLSRVEALEMAKNI